MYVSASPRSSEITNEEKQLARKALETLGQFLKQFWAARQQDARLINVLKKQPNASSNELFEQRHLLRKFQREARDRYTSLINSFAGIKGPKGKIVEEGAFHVLKPFEMDTKTRRIMSSLQDAMQQFKEAAEEFLEAFEDFNDKDQITKILTNSDKMDKIFQSVENIIDKQLRPHFEQNIIVYKIAHRILRRARLIKLLEA